VLVLRQEEVPQSGGTRLGLQLFDYARRFPPIAFFRFVEEALLVGINVLVHESLDLLLECFNVVGKFEMHNGLLLTGEGGGALLQEMGDSFLEIVTLQALEHFLFRAFKRFG